MPQKPSYDNAKQTSDNQACVGTGECACKCARPAKVSVTAYSAANESDKTRDECEEVKDGYHERRAKSPNILLSRTREEAEMGRGAAGLA